MEINNCITSEDTIKSVQLHVPATIIPDKATSCAHRIWDRVVTRTDIDVMENRNHPPVPVIGHIFPRPACSLDVQQLGYSESSFN
jgi:hypothetical protein